jgi:hypothetical protein
MANFKAYCQQLRGLTSQTVANFQDPTIVDGVTLQPNSGGDYVISSLLGQAHAGTLVFPFNQIKADGSMNYYEILLFRSTSVWSAWGAGHQYDTAKYAPFKLYRVTQRALGAAPFHATNDWRDLPNRNFPLAVTDPEDLLDGGTITLPYGLYFMVLHAICADTRLTFDGLDPGAPLVGLFLPNPVSLAEARSRRGSSTGWYFYVKPAGSVVDKTLIDFTIERNGYAAGGTDEEDVVAGQHGSALSQDILAGHYTDLLSADSPGLLCGSFTLGADGLPESKHEIIRFRVNRREWSD